jgi:hypothetical protein
MKFEELLKTVLSQEKRFTLLIKLVSVAVVHPTFVASCGRGFSEINLTGQYCIMAI